MARPDTRPYHHYPPEYAALLVRAAQWRDGEPAITLGPFTFKEAHASRRDLYRYKTKLQLAVDEDNSNDHARWLLSTFNGLQLTLQALAAPVGDKTHVIVVSPHPLVGALRAAEGRAILPSQDNAPKCLRPGQCTDPNFGPHNCTLCNPAYAAQWQRTDVDTPPPAADWRCACGSLNRADLPTCLACLTEKPT